MFAEHQLQRVNFGFAAVMCSWALLCAGVGSAQQSETSSPEPDKAFAKDPETDASNQEDLSEEEHELLELWNEYQKLLGEKQWDAALDIAAHLFDVAEYSLDPKDPRLGSLAVNYANLLQQQGHHQQAVDVMARARRHYEVLYAQDSREMVNLLMAEGDLLANRYDIRPQKRKYQEALDIVREDSGNTSEEYAELSMRAAIKLMDLSSSIEGERYLKTALRIFKDEFGEADERTARASFYLGRLVYGKGRRASAERYMKQALLGFDLTTEAGRRWNMITRRGLISFYQDRNRTDKVTEQLQEIGRLWEVTNPDDPAPLLLIRIDATYPDEMLERGREGRVEFIVTVDELGFIRSPELTKLDGGEAFIEPALEAVMRYRYVPRFVDGNAVAVDGIEVGVEFKLR